MPEAYIIYPTEIKTDSQVGGKAASLAALHHSELVIPAWFVLSTAAFYDSLVDSQRSALETTADSVSLLALLADLAPSPAVRVALERALTALCPPGETVAVRSSALDEDGTDHSFAGQLDSFLSIPPHDVGDKVIAVWRSAFSERILAYRCARELTLTPQPPAVIIQRMVKATRSGVAFSADPVTAQRDLAVVSAVAGLGTALVSGAVEADTYRVDRQNHIVKRAVVASQTGYEPWNGSSLQPSEAARNSNGSVSLVDISDGRAVSDLVGLPHCGSRDVQGAANYAGVDLLVQEQQVKPVLNDAEITAVADLARRTEQIFGCPQDIEWAFAGQQLYLLQSRPITTLTSSQAPAESVTLWDNSNIAESYPGVTTPLTFSFARRAYEEVYRQFCTLMNVPAETIIDHDRTFRQMLGFRQGRIYYNLLSWYQVLALLPGYKFNRHFMEQMMGVRESLPEHLRPAAGPVSRRARLQDGLRLIIAVLGLVVNFLTLPRRINAFNRRLNHALGDGRPDLSELRVDGLVSYYRALEQQLLTRWDAPLVNDFFAMIFYGLLRKLTEAWCGDKNGTLQNDLLSETGGIISAEPALKMWQMAQLAAADPAFVAILCEGSPDEIRVQMTYHSEFEAHYRAYLAKFGDRCFEELKLESPTLHDDPSSLLRAVGQLARLATTRSETEPRRKARQSESPGYQAERRVWNTLAQHRLRRLVFTWVLRNTRVLIRNRENLRFERTRLFGRARMIFVELGHRFCAHDLIDNPRDIFFLEVEEIFGLVEGTSTTRDPKGLVELRRTEFERFQAAAPPPDRFETHGIPDAGLEFQPASFNRRSVSAGPEDDASHTNHQSLQGLGCSPGLVRGTVRVVADPKQAKLRPGEILVAERTDPGWIVLFPVAAGLLVEHGSMLSHSAIVSREMGLPAVVALTGVTRWLKDGDLVEFDGSTGLVRKVAEAGTSNR